MRRTIIALALCGIVGVANANPRPIPRPAPQYHQRTIVIHEHHNTDVMAYVVAGIIVGVILYDISLPKCQNGIACVKF